MTIRSGSVNINGREWPIATVDFETYYSKDYTLQKLATSEYIRDDRFHAHGVSIKLGAGKTEWVTGAAIPQRMRSIPWKKYAVVAHNSAFDAFIMSHHYDAIPGFYMDTLSMARAAHGHHMRLDLGTLVKEHGIGVKDKRALESTKGILDLPPKTLKALGKYCTTDTDQDYKLFWKLIPFIPDDEMEIIDITLRMFCEPKLMIDIKRAEAAYAQEVSGKAKALLIAGTTIEQLSSSEKFATLLKQAGLRNLPMKLSPTTGKYLYAFAKTDEGLRELLNHPTNKTVRDLAAARVRIKTTIDETRSRRLIDAGKDGMKLPVLLHYCGAHTTRWSGGNKMNLQNLKRGGELRKSIIAPPGQVVVVADSAQIEARVNAWLFGQEDLIEAFRQKRDVYSEFASKIYGRPIDRKRVLVDKKGKPILKNGEKQYPDFMEGFVGKTCVLGLGYGMGPEKLQRTLKIGNGGYSLDMDIADCQRAVRVYRSSNANIVRGWHQMSHIISHMEKGDVGEYGPISYGKNFIRLPNGLFLLYYGLNVETGGSLPVWTYFGTRGLTTRIYGGLLTENVVQALSRCIIAWQMRIISKVYRVVMTTHDELVALASARDGQKALDFMIDTMKTPPPWAVGLPLAAEGGFDVCYSK